MPGPKVTHDFLVEAKIFQQSSEEDPRGAIMSDSRSEGDYDDDYEAL